MWTQEDIRVASVLEAGLGQVRVVEVIKHKENSMSDAMGDTPSEDGMWEPGEETSTAPGGVTYPEHHYSLADHVYTWSPKLPDGSMLVIRSQSADGLVEAAEAIAPLAGRLRAAWQMAIGTVTPPPAAPIPPAGMSQPNFNPQMPPPGQPYPGQPAWQQGGAPQAQAAPQWGAPQAAQQPARKEYPAPAGWYKLNVPFPGGKDQLHALATQLGIPKGNPNKGGVYNFFGLSPSGSPGKAWYCAPEAAQAFGQFTPMAA